MTLSYAEAMKQKRQAQAAKTAVKIDGSSSTAQTQHQTTTSQDRRVPKPTTSVWGKQETPASSAPSVWGKPAAPAVKVKASANAWGKATTPHSQKQHQQQSIKKEETIQKQTPETSASNDWKMVANSKQPIKKEETIQKQTPETSASNDWKMVATSKQPVSILSPPGTSNRKKHADNDKAKKPRQPAAETSKQKRNPAATANNKPKSSKPKPTLKSMSINDLISGHSNKKKAKGRNNNMSSQPTMKISASPKPLQVNSATDFPSLSTASRSAAPKSAPKPVPVKPKITSMKTNKVTLAAKRGGEATNKKKASGRKKDVKRKGASTSLLSPSLASVFFKPQQQDNRGDGEELQLLRLMQERTVYKKKGRQRVAPRKKKFTALKKKVLQERLKKWRELHPEETEEEAQKNQSSPTKAITSKETCSICLYNYTCRDDLEDDDEYEEITENLREMAAKLGGFEQVFIPRNLEERSGKYPAFVKFKTAAEACAAKACWSDLVVGGEVLEVFSLDESTVDDSEATEWVDKMLVAEYNKRDGSDNAVQKMNPDGPAEVVIESVLTEDDYSDEDCMVESLAYLKEIAQQFGSVSEVRASEAKDGKVRVICSAGSSQSIVDGLCSTVISGNSLLASALVPPESNSGLSNKAISNVMILENFLTEDDLEDEDCLNETLNDVRELAEKHGEIASVVADNGAVKVSFVGDVSIAQLAVDELDGLCLSGTIVRARIENNVVDRDNTGDCIYLQNILTEDDLEDEDCLEETLNDIRQLVSNFGDVLDAEVIRKENIGIVKITYKEPQPSLEKALSGLDGMVLGGQIVSASLSMSADEMQPEATSPIGSAKPVSVDGKRKTDENSEDIVPKKARTDDKKPLYSGDKLIPEIFAECKRVPKIPNAAGPREYAKLVNDERVRPLLTEMLKELMRLQKRAIEDKNAKARRRVVMGLREVARGIRSHKVKMVVMANNLDQYGAIDDKLQEIIDLAHNEDVPLFFEFTKRSLGKAVGKSIKVAVVGIQNADGAYQPFKQLGSIAAKF